MSQTRPDVERVFAAESDVSRQKRIASDEMRRIRAVELHRVGRQLHHSRIARRVAHSLNNPSADFDQSDAPYFADVVNRDCSPVAAHAERSASKRAVGQTNLIRINVGKRQRIVRLTVRTEIGFDNARKTANAVIIIVRKSRTMKLI